MNHSTKPKIRMENQVVVDVSRPIECLTALNEHNIQLANEVIDESSDLFETFGIKEVSFNENDLLLSVSAEKIVLIKTFPTPKNQLPESMKAEDYDFADYMPTLFGSVVFGTLAFDFLFDDLRSVLEEIFSKLTRAQQTLYQIRRVKEDLHAIFPGIILPETNETATYHRCTPVHGNTEIVPSSFTITASPAVICYDKQRHLLEDLKKGYKISGQIPCWPDTKNVLDLYHFSSVCKKRGEGAWEYWCSGSITGTFALKWETTEILETSDLLIGLSDFCRPGYFFSPIMGWIVNRYNVPTMIENYPVRNNGLLQFTLFGNNISIHVDGRFVYQFLNCAAANTLYPVILWSGKQPIVATFV